MAGGLALLAQRLPAADLDDLRAVRVLEEDLVAREEFQRVGGALLAVDVLLKPDLRKTIHVREHDLLKRHSKEIWPRVRVSVPVDGFLHESGQTPFHQVEGLDVKLG